MILDVILEKGSEVARRKVDAPDGIATIGRHPSNSLPLESANVSRTHVKVAVRGDKLRIEDTSTNGTMVGDVFLSRSAADVPFGTPIVLGDYTMRILPQPKPEPAPAPLPAAPAAAAAAKAGWSRARAAPAPAPRCSRIKCR